ncbi:lens fiber major intrinsic protein [Massarina eburnea CBS 473.64]|uniref:Lens fiber major intrinsic protein n=1 Tax=Massarina eburnea CBS 473.64 TaxID=1395130 RepID=A0A6A6S5N0_9PLEO|nr:lens fiber major intrinsic protein [Massarina eburnea CBS 473.64]
MSDKGSESILPISEPAQSLKGGFDSDAGKAVRMAKVELPVFLGEFVGTFMFLFFAFAGTQIAAESTPPNPLQPIDQIIPPSPAKLLYISLAFGISLAVNVAIFADVSGGMFNPAVTTALWIVGMIRWQRALHTIAAQILGAIIASFAVSAILPGALPVNTTLHVSASVTQGLFLEVFLTAQLILTILMLPSGPSKPMYCGMALFIAELAGVYLTGGSLNPARSIGPAAVLGAQSTDWIYWLGPGLGAGLAAGTFILIKTLQNGKL